MTLSLVIRCTFLLESSKKSLTRHPVPTKPSPCPGISFPIAQVANIHFFALLSLSFLSECSGTNDEPEGLSAPLESGMFFLTCSIPNPEDTRSFTAIPITFTTVINHHQRPNPEACEAHVTSCHRICYFDQRSKTR